MINYPINTSSELVIWGKALPKKTLSQKDLDYLVKFTHTDLPTVDFIWQEMDRIWDSYGLNNRLSLSNQPIIDFYSHPVWIINGLFSSVDPESALHRESIAELVKKLGANHIADYGGGFGELALKLSGLVPETDIAIVEPYPSKLGKSRIAGKKNVRYINRLDKQYDCVIAQDVLEHVERPLELAAEMANATKIGGYLIFANCFYPVIKCHLPSTFYLRHTFKWLAKSMGLKFEKRVEGAEHALLFKKICEINQSSLNNLKHIAKTVGPLLNEMARLYRAPKSFMRVIRS